MRRLFVAATLGAAVFALIAGTAAAAMPHASAAGLARPSSAHEAAFGVAHAKARFVPLGARLAGTTTVDGTVYNSSHAALPGVAMEWDALVNGSWTYGEGTTDGSGHYAMTANATADGEIYAYPDDYSTLGRGSRTWTNGGSDTDDLYPGRVNLTATRGGPWAGYDNTGITVRLYGETEYSRGVVAPADPKSTASGTVDALDGTYDQGGSVKWYWDEGIEFPGPVIVASGATSATSVTVSEADAQRLSIAKPYGGSGKPGVTVTIQRSNFPAGWRNSVSGYSDGPKLSAFKDYGVKVSLGAASENLSVKIPSTAKPGYQYFVGFQHVDPSGGSLPLYVEEAYQVCTMKPSKTSITKGTRIRVTGVVPTENHWGSKLGLHKKVYLLWHKGTAAVPTTQKALKSWYQVGKTLKCTGTGAYASAYFKPLATGTFLVYYERDNWYWGGYTSTAKVKVR